MQFGQNLISFGHFASEEIKDKVNYSTAHYRPDTLLLIFLVDSFSWKKD